MNIFFILLLTALVLNLYLSVRNIWVYEIRRKALAYIFSQENWRELLTKFDTISYNSMMLDFGKSPKSLLPPEIKDNI